MALFDTARAKADFVAARAPLPLFVAAGDFHFAQGTREQQEMALTIYSQAGDVLAEMLQPNEKALLRLKRAQVLMRRAAARRRAKN